MNEKLSKLQEQIDLLVSGAAAGVPLSQPHQASVTPIPTSLPGQRHSAPSSSHTDDSHPSSSLRRSRAARHPQYMGPTSSAFSFGVAKNSLQRMGIQSGTGLGENVTTSRSTTPVGNSMLSGDPLPSRDPLLSITQHEAIRLVNAYEEDTGTLYPFVDTNLVLSTAVDFYNGTTPNQGGSGDANMLSGGTLDILKLVIAIASVVEGHGPTILSQRLLENVESGFEGRMCGPSVDVLEIQAWTLMVSILAIDKGFG